MSRRSLFLILLISVSCLPALVSAQKRQPKAPVCIVEEITADSIHVVEMPDGLWELIDYDPGERRKEKMVNSRPFTVQVYGDKSRNEANARASQVQSRFPGYHVRRHYSSPYFRVYLGAFETSREAQVLVNEVKRAFPSFANEVHWTKTSVAGSKKK